MPDELLTAAELAARLRVRPDTLKAWSRRGCIPAVRITPKVVRFDLDAVLASLKTTTIDREVPRA